MRNLLLFTCCLTTFAYLGCDEQPTLHNDPVNSIQLQIEHQLVTGFGGDLCTQHITAKCFDSDSVPVAGAQVEFSIQNRQDWKGTITPIDSITDQNGMMRAVYSVDLVQSGTVAIKAKAGQLEESANIYLSLLDNTPLHLQIEASRRILTLLPNQLRTLDICLMVEDSVNQNPVSAVPVRFSLDPPNMGTLSSYSGTTDQNGKLLIQFQNIPAEQPIYGTCNVIAQVGEQVASTPIDLRPIASPAHLHISPRDTTVYVPEGEDFVFDLSALEMVITDEGGVGVPVRIKDIQIEILYDAQTEPFPFIDPHILAIHTNGYYGKIVIIFTITLDSEEFEPLAAEMELFVLRR